MIITLYKPQAALLSETLQKFLPERLESSNVKVARLNLGIGATWYPLSNFNSMQALIAGRENYVKSDSR